MSFNTSPKISSVIIVPRNGYVNRLQAVASAAILAEDLGADFQMCWESQEVAPAPPEMIFGPAFLDQVALSPHEFQVQVGIDYLDVPKFLNEDPRNIFLAGYEFGEQHFMQDLRRRIDQLHETKDLVISAGGHFSIDPTAEATNERGNWYRQLSFATEIATVAKRLIDQHVPYLGLHLRYTDRSHQTPLDRDIKAAILSQVDKTGINSVFIASDTAQRRDKWLEVLSSLELHPWYAESIAINRSHELAGVSAMVDWVVLGHARSSVYFAASSFGHEAAVMAKTVGISSPLSAHGLTRAQSRGKEIWKSLMNYPRNHWK